MRRVPLPGACPRCLCPVHHDRSARSISLPAWAPSAPVPWPPSASALANTCAAGGAVVCLAVAARGASFGAGAASAPALQAGVHQAARLEQGVAGDAACGAGWGWFRGHGRQDPAACFMLLRIPPPPRKPSIAATASCAAALPPLPNPPAPGRAAPAMCSCMSTSSSRSRSTMALTAAAGLLASCACSSLRRGMMRSAAAWSCRAPGAWGGGRGREQQDCCTVPCMHCWASSSAQPGS